VGTPRRTSVPISSHDAGLWPRFKWSEVNPTFPDQTILESLEDTTSYTGLGLNPYGVGLSLPKTNSVYLRGVASIERYPAYQTKSPELRTGWLMGQGSQDYSPVIYDVSGLAGVTTGLFPTIVFCRNALTSDVYEAALAVLNIAGAAMSLPATPGTGNWEAIRFIPQGLPALDAALSELLGWTRAIKAGLQDVTDVIVAYIEFLQGRILEMQALLVRIDGLIASLTGFELPAVAGLIVTGNGTDGILSGLITADNKPSDAPETYGAGLVFLAGGLSPALIEILQSFFPEAE